MEKWYLACYKTGKQNAFKAQLFLSRPDINAVAFIPQIYSYHHRSDRPGQFRKTMEPLFPGYMFICFDPEITHTSKISGCPGVNHLVRFADKILPIHDAIIEEIMALPVCTYASELRERNKCRRGSVLTVIQHEELIKVVTEKNGLERSAMFHTYVRSLTGQD